MEMWISKYALSSEITKERGEAKGEYFYPDDRKFVSFKIGKDAHETQEAAAVEAEKARLKKIASLKKQINKLERRKFTA